ncbi:hypothetical protein [Lederbergia lenta]|uniref:hypothetical protein n=1 Tax=Lederbergia lenta TaxID=1467 RepID=UPI00204038A4|nr:hypothetical protein [Lederbergia lenta]MCM3109918.1 hypothetical protein [Lederbergia lenta]
MNKIVKLEAIKYFLENVLDDRHPLEERKGFMLHHGKKTCQGFPEWSDFYGVRLKPIDDISWEELDKLVSEITS